MKRIISIILIVGILGGIIFFAVKSYNKNDGNLNVIGLPSINSEESEEVFGVEPVVVGEVKKVDDTTNTFIHKGYNFTLNFPASMTASNFREGAGEQIQFQGTGGDWFQIYVTMWDEDGDITTARIKKDIPDIVINSPQNVIIGPKQIDGVGPHALIFFSKDSGLGETREVWFVQNGYLYQVTSKKSFDLKLGQVLSTINFN